MANKRLWVGTIDLSLLKGAHVSKGADGKESVVIPVEENPSVFLGAADKGGHIYLDLEIRESPKNDYGHTHFIKLSVNRKKREGLSDEKLRELTPIVGNIKEIGRKDDDMPEGM